MTEIGIEQHLDQILKSDPKNWLGYKRHLANFVAIRDRIEDCDFEEGDCFIRFRVRSDSLAMNKLFQVYELGDLFPNIEWRRIIRTDLSPVLLQKPSAFLPAYAFALDRSLTLLYWGQQQAFFDPERLRSMKLRNMLFTVHHPSNFVFSAANLAWPKSVENILVGSAVINEMAKRYLFNFLFGPQFGPTETVWSESPYVIVGDRRVDLYTVHKTICHIARPPQSSGKHEFASVDVLDSNLHTTRVSCFLSETFRDVRQGQIFEALLTKHVGFSNSGAPDSRVVLFPFESNDFFGSDAQGVLLTALSLILRDLYLRSSENQLINFDLGSVIAKLASIFRDYPFRKFEWGDLGSRIVTTNEGMKMLVSLLGTYEVRGSEVRFLHPSLLEITMSLFRNVDQLDYGLFAPLLSYLADQLPSMATNSNVNLYHKFEVQKQIEGISKQALGLGAINNLLDSLSAAGRSFIPLSKSLNRTEANTYSPRRAGADF